MHYALIPNFIETHAPKLHSFVLVNTVILMEE